MRIRRKGLWVLAVLGGFLLVLFVLVVGPWWLTRHPHQGLTAEQELKAKNDVRTTLVQTLGGLAVAGGLIVTFRTYRLNQSQQVTETYTKAVEQLGHDQAPVRLGALHSLARLGQDNPQRRETVVDVLCAYLRMPYTPPDREEAGPAAARQPATATRPRHDPAQELQVRQTAQRLLAEHLRRPPETSGGDAQHRRPSPDEAFWPGISLDLTGATLVDFDFARISVVQAQFDRATFQGTAWFSKAAFQGGAWFDRASFRGDAEFVQATFQSYAEFVDAAFQRDAWFHKAAFQGGAGFSGATFQRDARFLEATFQRGAWFSGATFKDAGRFSKAAFQGAAGFDGAKFRGDTEFDGVSFEYDAEFSGAAFEGDTKFVEAAFEGAARFDGATFTSDNGGKGVVGAQVLYLDDPDLNKNDRRVWPDGYTVRPDPADPARGTVVYAEQAEEPEPAVPPPDRPADNGLGTG